MENVFLKCLEEAERGKHIVEEYYNAHVNNGKNRVVVLIFPDDDSRLLLSVFHYLDRFLNEYNYDLAIILSSIDLSDYDFPSYTLKQLFFYDIDHSAMISVLRFISFIDCPNIRLLSLRMPFNMKVESLIGFKDVTVDKITYYSLFLILGRRH